MSSLFSLDTAKTLLSKLTYEKFLCLALGWYLHAHYAKQVVAFLGG